MLRVRNQFDTMSSMLSCQIDILPASPHTWIIPFSPAVNKYPGLRECKAKLLVLEGACSTYQVQVLILMATGG